MEDYPRRLAVYFSKILRAGTQVSESWLRQTTQDMEELLKTKTVDEIRELILAYKKSNPKARPYRVADLFQTTRDSLVKQGEFYYHHELQLTSGPPREVEQEDGTYKIVTEPFFLEIRPNYTIDDLRQYFENLMEIKHPEVKRDNGALRFLVDKHGLDLVLHTIDHVHGSCVMESKEFPSTAISLANFIHDGEKHMELNINYLMSVGKYKIVPKQEQGGEV